MRKALTKMICMFCAVLMAITMIPALPAKAAAVQSLESYLKARGKTVSTATATDIKNYFLTKSNNSKYIECLNKCQVDVSFARNNKSDYEQKKAFYDFIMKYASKINSRCGKEVKKILDPLYIHTCFEQMAYGNSYDDVVYGVIGAFNRISTYTGVFENIIKCHTTAMSAEYKMIKKRISTLKNIEGFVKDYNKFDAEMAAEIYLYSLTVPDGKTFQLGELAWGIEDINVKKRYLSLINNNYEGGKKYVYKKITKEYAEKLFLFNVVYLDNPNEAWQYLR